ncbi:MAG: hypothetical protein V1794_14230, partial [Candidatus Glassbacteria bacterium]
AQISFTLYGWANAVNAALLTKVAIPLVNQSMPVYILLLSLLITGVLAFFREEIIAAVDSF